MALGKSISLFLIDGNANGRVVCELFNWTGKAYRIPRTMLRDSNGRSELNKAGVYFLFGRDEYDPDALQVYVGEAEEVYKRLVQQQEKDFWTEAVVFISKDENLNKAHIKYLEYRIVQEARRANRVTLQNGNTPNCPSISEPEEAVMTEYFQNLKLLVGTLGYKVFEPLSQPDRRDQTIYQIDAARGAKAKAVVTNEGVVVRAKSIAAANCVPSTPEYVLQLRERLLDNGVLRESNGTLHFTKDYRFTSPSTAAAVVMGRSANGRIEWKGRRGRTLKDIEEAQNAV